MRSNINGHSLLVAQERSYVTPTADVELLPSQCIARAIGDGTNYTITLPPVTECAGMFFVVTYGTLVTSADITVSDHGDSLSWTDYVLTVEEDFVLLFSTGAEWIEVASVVTAA